MVCAWVGESLQPPAHLWSSGNAMFGDSCTFNVFVRGGAVGTVEIIVHVVVVVVVVGVVVVEIL